jgi:hypothetical protein
MTPVPAVEGVFFRPPLAIARVGGSDTPLDSFVWGADPTIHGAHRTVIRPAVSFEVLSDGSLRPYQPAAIQFRDRGLLRPVAPFFELWVKFANGRCEPLTPRFLRSRDASTDNVEYTVIVANRKAQRRTGSATCAFIAQAVVSASDCERKPLSAYSPHTSGQEPLVYRDSPIPLGYFQAIRPIERIAMDIDLSILRVRFTPARGEVYGPPTAVAGPASPLQPGVALAPATLGGRLHDIVPPQNRILNPNTPWSRYILAERDDDPQPSDSYDGANVGNTRSWGVVDDTCDGIIEAQVVIGERRFVANARIFSSCPDYAPDRRPFYSVADDLADRDLPPIKVTRTTISDTQHEIGDLFERAFETASLFNLDAMRERAVAENADMPSLRQNRGLPKIDDSSMTSADKPYADLTADLFEEGAEKASLPGFRLPYAAAAQFKHESLCDTETLLTVLRANARHVQALVRPPFGRFHQLPARVPAQPNPKFRDPRVKRDQFHDMRMPPYMRDSDFLPLSITYRQYHALMELIRYLRRRGSMLVDRPDTPVARRTFELETRQAALPPKYRRRLRKDYR